MSSNTPPLERKSTILGEAVEQATDYDGRRKQSASDAGTKTPTLVENSDVGSNRDASAEPIAVHPSFLSRLRKWVERQAGSVSLPAFLVSMIVHMTVLILLALWTLSSGGGVGPEFAFIASQDQPQDDAADIEIQQLASADSDPAPSAAAAAEIMDAAVSRPANKPTELGNVIANLLDQPPAPAELSSSAASIIELTQNSTEVTLGHSGIDGRSPGKRRELALKRGGSVESEAAVELALEWLAAHQRPNGSWTLLHTKPECKGDCTHEGANDRYNPAATGLALLAFLGAGYTHRDGKHAATVRSGLYYLLQVMEETPTTGSFLWGSPQGMYNHGIATFALCEAYQLSDDEWLRDPAQKAINFMAIAQNQAGGWGYLPKQPGDLTLTGWQTMALKSAASAGLRVPTSAILRIDNFLDTQTDSKRVFYGYRSPEKSANCTAIALILRLFRGWRTTDPRILEGASYLAREGLSQTDMYRNYYVTLFLFHLGDPLFARWNEPMRDYLVKSQSHQGHAAGSWYFEDRFGDKGGRLYNTAICAMTLEVYYRFSPLYLNIDKPFEF